MNDVAEIIRALAALAWPVVVGVFLWQFKGELARLLARLQKASGPGFDLEFSEQLDELQRSAEAAAEAVPAIEAGQSADAADDALRPVREIVEEAARSPRAALMLLAAEIERRVRRVAAQRGALWANPDVWRNRPVTSNTLREFDMPQPVLDAVDQFRRVRNRIVHGRHVGEDEIWRAIDSGLMILDALERAPREVNVVYAPRVPLYSDAEGVHEREDVHGVVLKTFHSDTPDEHQLRIFPTTRDHHREGQLVAWQWNTDTTVAWGESWYRHPDTGQIEYAFSGSAEFIGPPLDDID